MTETTTFREIMQHLWTGAEADLIVVKHSESRNTGGQRRKYTGARFNINKHSKTEQTELIEQIERTDDYAYNQVINLILPNGDLKKIYKIGIKEFNGKTVII